MPHPLAFKTYNRVMAILKVARMGHPVLREKARPLAASEIRSPEVQRLIDDMFETMAEYHGVGLAAPQVHESVRIFVAGFPSDRDSDEERDEHDVPLMTLINPEITIVGREEEEDWEGCLSIPDIRGRVPRPYRLVARAYDRDGKRIEITASGYTARVIQHETDHLDGILFFDRMESFETLTFIEEFGRFWGGRSGGNRDQE